MDVRIDGRTVLLTHADDPLGQALDAAFSAAGGRVIVPRTEVADSDLASVDVLVNHAPDAPRAAFLDLDDACWDRAIRQRLDAPFLWVRRLAPGMIARSSGRILTLLPHEAFGPSRNRSELMTVSAGLVGLTRALAKELGPAGITTNAVVSGRLRSAPNARVAARTTAPAGRPVTPEEIAALCVFLASDLGGSINGQVLHATGGRFMG